NTANQVQFRTPPVRSDSDLIGFFIGVCQMKRIPLTQGMFAIVDDKNYEWLMQWKWFLHKGRNTNYARRHSRIRGKRGKVYMHRQILNASPGVLIDHKNDNGLDNREKNLRSCTPSQNIANSIGHKNGSSQFKGVSWSKNKRKWEAFIGYKNKKINLGVYSKEEDAAKAYDKKAKEIYGEFARANYAR
ncbi:hypothetical protein LCGC14_1421440, partial [marine sediment metagenome]